MKTVFSEKQKEKCYKLNNGWCEVCQIRKIREYHHIIPVSEGGKSTDDNIAGLCHLCHDYVPGNIPDGYIDEFEIYKESGGTNFRLCFPFFLQGFGLGKKYKGHSKNEIVMAHKKYITTKKQAIKIIRGIRRRQENLGL